MSDTKQRIAEYKKLLPGLKERVVAMALLMIISLALMTTTTMAWVVLSRNPEVSNVTTNVASNGNLARSSPTYPSPLESKHDCQAHIQRSPFSAS